ncbi:g6777 [Coccomyxa elongata]
MGGVTQQRQLDTRAGDIEAFRGAAHRFDASDLTGVKDANGRNALHFSASHGRTDFVGYLVSEQHFEVDATDDSGETSLDLAAASGHPSTVAALLNLGAKAAGKGTGDPQPIHWAAQSGNVTCVELLLEHGATVDPASNSGTPLLWAIGATKRECASFLLDKGANPNGQGDNGVSACLLAAATGSEELLRRLIDMGADVNAAATGGVTPLHVAAEVGLKDVVQILLKGGANPNAKEQNMSARPIDAAAVAQHREIVEMLLPCTTPAEGAEWTADSLLAEAAAEAAAHRHTHEHTGGCCGHDHSHDEEAEEIEVPAPDEYDLDKAKVLKRAGDEAFVKGQFPAAVEHYSGALRHNTSDHALWANRSAAAFRTGAFQDALLDARRARTVDPRYAKAYYREGSAAEALEQWEDAAQAYFQGCRLDPQNIALAQAFHGVVQKAREAHKKAHEHAHEHGHSHDCSEHCSH